MQLKYISATQAATRLDVTRTYIKALGAKGRIKGAIKIGNQWAIPFPPKILPAAK